MASAYELWMGYRLWASSKEVNMARARSERDYAQSKRKENEPYTVIYLVAQAREANWNAIMWKRELRELTEARAAKRQQVAS